LPRFELATTISLVKISLGGKVALVDLNDTEREVVRERLRAAVEGPFFREWEFHTLFDVTRAEVKGVVNSWPNVDERLAEVYLGLAKRSWIDIPEVEGPACSQLFQQIDVRSHI
jgi:hypothetical protein